jgi:hypothetical protein
MAKKTSPQRELHRRADNGQFTTKEYAEKHPKTTVKEHRPVKRK